MARDARTSQGIARLMRGGAGRRADGDAGLVDIEVVLAHTFGEWAASFSLKGSDGSCDVRDVGAFADLMEAGAFHAYSKRLAFAHVPESFTERGRAVAAFVQEAVTLRRQLSGSVDGCVRGGASVARVNGRSLSLTPREVVALLDANESCTFLVCDEGHLSHRALRAHTVKGAPPVQVTMAYEPRRGGFSLAVRDWAVVIAAGARVYVWHDDVFYRCPEGFALAADFLKEAYEGSDDALFVAEADMPLFCATVLPTLEAYLDTDVPDEAQAYRFVPCELSFYLDKNLLGVTCRVVARYRDRSIDLFAEGAQDEEGDACASLRDERAEAQARQVVARFFDVSGEAYVDAVRKREAAARGGDAHRALDALRAEENFACTPFIPLADEERVGSFLFGGLAQLRERGEVLTTPAFDRLLFPAKPVITVGLSLAGDLVNLEVMATELSEAELSGVLSSYRRRKRFHRLRSGVFLNVADFDLEHLAQVAHDLGLSPRQLASGAVELPAYQAFYLDEQLGQARKDEGFAQLVRAFDDGGGQGARPVPEGLRATLRPYQKEGFDWLNRMVDARFGGVLADEMGLGKSVQLIAFLLARAEEARSVGPSLIVCPASLVYNWMAELSRFAPTLRAVAVAGGKAERAAARRRAADVLVASYDAVRIDAAEFASLDFYCCALDEAQYVKNHATKTARAVRRVTARCRFALTGTPIENRPAELWSLFDFLMPGLLGSAMRFREDYEVGVLAGSGSEDAVARLAHRIAPFMLRRRKADVLTELPEKLQHTVYAHLEGEQARLYAAHEQQLRDHLNEQKRETQANSRNRAHKTQEVSKVEVLAELTRLRQLCCDPSLLYEEYRGPAAKVDVIMGLLDQARAAGRKTLVFSQFTSFLAVIERELAARDVPFFCITGAMPKKKRVALVDAFNDDDTPVFLVSLKAGGTGLNLTGATVVVHADPWWNAAAQNQAADRAHRIGQSRDVDVYRVIAKGTIEERIVRLQEKKADLADGLLGDGAVSLATLTKEAVLELLRDC